MKQEYKDLLLKYLCAALPYGVKFGCDIKGVWTLKGITHNGVHYICWPGAVALEVVKPYLRPMSSMTEEEHKEYEQWLPDGYCVNTFVWLLENHFDFMGLIPKGLAIAVTKENNPY